MLRELLQRLRERNQRVNEIDDEYRAQHKVEQRRKSADRREVEDFYAEQEEKAIHEQAQKIRAMRQRQSWEGGPNILHEKNVFKNHHSILTDNPKLNSWGPQKSKEGRMFWI